MRRALFCTMLVVQVFFAHAACAQSLAGGGTLDVPVLRIIAVLLLAIGAVFAAALFLRRKIYGDTQLLAGLRIVRTSAPKRVVMVEVRRISAGSEVCLLAWEGSEYLILSSQAGSEIVDRRPIATEPADGQAS